MNLPIASHGIAALAVAALLAGEPPSPALSMDRAVALALEANRQLLQGDLASRQSEQRVAQARKKRLPVTSIEVVGSRLLGGVEFRFPEEAFGTLPGGGPVPATDVEFTSDAGFNTFITASVMQPVSQLYRAGLGVKASEAALDSDREAHRAARAQVASSVRSLYAALAADEFALEASLTSEKALTELEREVTGRVERGAALGADALEVRSRLSQAWYRTASLRNTIASRREQLNDLMGRELDTPFALEPLPEPDAVPEEIEQAQRTALERRPELRRAAADLRQAELAVRIKRCWRRGSCGCGPC